MKRTVLIVLTTVVLLSFAVTALAITNSEYEKAVKFYNAGKYPEAVNLLKDYVKKNPDPAAYYRIGYGLYKMKKFDEAKEYFKEAYIIDPSYSFGPTGVPVNYPKTRKIAKPSAEKAS
jgi:TolA-binding protein